MPIQSSPDDSRLPSAGKQDALPRAWVVLPALVLGSLAAAVGASGGNTELFRALNAAASGLPASMWAILTVCGSVLGAIALLAPTLKTRPRLLASAFLAAPLAILFSEGSKRYFDVLRPAGVLAADSFNLIGQKLYVHAFPSGHSTTAFVAAAALVLAWHRAERRPLVGPLVLGAAGLVAFSRIAVGAHWPLDVLTGAAGGWLCGACGVWLSARLRFWEGPGGVRAMATVALATSLALLFVDGGQPDVRLFRIGLAAWGIGGAAAALMQGREDLQS